MGWNIDLGLIQDYKDGRSFAISQIYIAQIDVRRITKSKCIINEIVFLVCRICIYHE